MWCEKRDPIVAELNQMLESKTYGAIISGHRHLCIAKANLLLKVRMYEFVALIKDKP